MDKGKEDPIRSYARYPTVVAFPSHHRLPGVVGDHQQRNGTGLAEVAARFLVTQNGCGAPTVYAGTLTCAK